ncbi:hypothetical protein AAG570_011858 [Ranatra chinensis]|uniref:GON domain-containing protein n=1 Tax=Ranatra chinensis TaxID=642074 RepID=A0ABD0YH44_9HEMI
MESKRRNMFQKNKTQENGNMSSCLALQHNLRVTKDGEYIMRMRHRILSIYCSQMHTSNPKEFITLHAGEAENYAEIYDKRVTDPGTCPHGGERNEYCHCEKNMNRDVGFTGFSKIRINITSLIVDTKDFTFSKQVRGSRVPYGEAGDCYSKDNCPQGKNESDRQMRRTLWNVRPKTWTYVGHPSTIIGVLTLGLIPDQCRWACRTDVSMALKLSHERE